MTAGSRLRKERLDKGRTLEEISGATKIPLRHLGSIEEDRFDRLPGLVFARNFVRTYALALELDPAPLVAQLPRQDESAFKLPEPPNRSPRRSSASSLLTDLLSHSLNPVASSIAWLLIAVAAGSTAYVYFNHSAASRVGVSDRTRGVTPSPFPRTQLPPAPAASQTSPAPAPKGPPVAKPTGAAPVQVIFTAHAPAWVQVSADGKTAFIGTLQSNETKEITAEEHVRISTGNAGALTISLNGRTIDSLGSLGQVRAVTLTAEGPEPGPKDPSPPPDPL